MWVPREDPIVRTVLEKSQNKSFLDCPFNLKRAESSS
jgi:hypothetical protein